MKKLITILITSLFFGSCANQQSTCTSQSNDPVCLVGTTLGADASLLKVEFKESHYFDPNLNAWVTIPSIDFTSGVVNTTIPVYSSYVDLGLSEGLRSVALAGEQKSAAASSAQNQIPYIEFAAKDGVSYLYRYQKLSLAGVVLVDQSGPVNVVGTRAFIPFFNASFNNQYYTSSDTLGTRYKNLIQITAESNKKAGPVYQLQFQSVFSIQNFDFQSSFAQSMKDFKLTDRWKFYNNPTNTGPNTELGFLTLSDKKALTTTTVTDARVVFKTPVKLELQEQIFFELPFQGDLFKVSGTVVPDRGNKFYTTTLHLDSIKDFNLKLTLGGLPLTKNSLTYDFLGFPVGKRFDLGIAYDFTPNVSYGAGPSGGDPASLGLLYPLKPVCYELKNQNYAPWVKEPLRAAVTALGNYAAVCDLDTTSEVQTTAPAIGQLDTWYNFFSFAPYRPDKNELGHLFGIKSVTFRIETCFKVQVKAMTEALWETRTRGGSNCGDSAADDSWTFVTIEKTFTIFDDLARFTTVPGLNSVLTRFQNTSTEVYPVMKFNNENLNGDLIRHIY